MAPRRPGWMRAAFVLTIATLLADAVYLYGVKFSHAVHADAAATVLMADRALDAHSPVVSDWFYGNGEVWFFAPHLAALLPVAIAGVSLGALQAAVLLGFALELAAAIWAFRRAGSDRLTALFAASLMLMAWSRLHVLFVYVELAYGFASAIYVVLYSLPATLLLPCEQSSSRRRALIAALFLFLVFAVSIQSPARGLVFTAAPVIFGCLWPWRDVSWKKRGVVAGGSLGAFGAAVLGYELWIKRVVTFSIPSGHNDFVVKDLAGMKQNVATLAKGIAFLAGEQGQVNLLVVPPILFMIGAVALVARHAFASRALTVKRFACVAVLSQLGAALVPLLVGNLVVNPWSVRYLMPSLILCFGLAAVVSVEELSLPLAAEAGRRARAWHRSSLAWVLLAPLTALFALLRIVGSYSLENERGQWANRDAHAALATELTSRGLTHGFATYWNGNLVTLLSHGKTLTCPVYLGAGILPYKWNARTTCFDPAILPDRFYVASTPEERDLVAIATKAFPAPVDRFRAGDYFDVAVYEKEHTELSWMEIPLADGANLKLPLHMRASFPQLRRMNGEAHGDAVVAKGEEGCVVFGPYMELPKGHYVVRWAGHVDAPTGDVSFDVAVKNSFTGKPQIVAERSVRASELPADKRGELVGIAVDFDAPVQDFEARVFSRGGARFTLDELTLERR